MIATSLIKCLVGIVNFILTPVSILGWGFNLALCSPLGEFLKIVYYVLPISKLSPIITFIVAMIIFRSLISLVKTIWQLIPGL